jgi:hypothetical protein
LRRPLLPRLPSFPSRPPLAARAFSLRPPLLRLPLFLPLPPPAAEFTFLWPPPRRRPSLSLPPSLAVELLVALQLLSAAELLLLGLQQLRFHVLFHFSLLLLPPHFPLSPLSAAILLFLSFLLLLLLRLCLRKVWFMVHRACSSAILSFRLPPPPLAVSLLFSLPRPVRLRKTFSAHSPRCRLVFQILILAPCHRLLALHFRPRSDKLLPVTVIFHHHPVLSNSRVRRRKRGLLGIFFRERLRLRWQALSLRR